MLSRLELIQKADAMRQAPTTCESRALDSLWSLTRPERQVVFGFYILDFVVPNRLLVIEIDGESHANQREHDQKRDAFCVDLGLRVLRIPNALAHLVVNELAHYPEVDGWEKVWGKAQRKALSKQMRIEEKKQVPLAERKAVLSKDRRLRQAIRVLAVLRVQGLGGSARAQELHALIAELKPAAPDKPTKPSKSRKPSKPSKKKKTPENQQARLDAEREFQVRNQAAARRAKKKRRLHEAAIAQAAAMQARVAALAAITEW